MGAGAMSDAPSDGLAVVQLFQLIRDQVRESLGDDGYDALLLHNSPDRLRNYQADPYRYVKGGSKERH
jgi:hypothetical protein